MRLASIAPRLAAARDQMVETERVLGWLRDNSWTGGAKVLVPVEAYVRRASRGGQVVETGTWEWVSVDRVVQGDAAPYPIRGFIDRSSLYDDPPHARVSGQWAFWEVADIKSVVWENPELFELNPTFPRPAMVKPGEKITLLSHDYDDWWVHRP